MMAAIESFARKGYHATTTRDIATAAGMSPAALYVHFPSKAAVLFAIARSGHEQALELVRGAIAASDDPEQRIRRIVEEFTAWHARRHRIARIVQYELHGLDAGDFDVVRRLRRQTDQLVRDVIADGVAAGRFQATDVPTAARAVLSLGIDVARWYTERAQPSPDELGRQYADLVLRMLRA
ncbi:MAG: TetR family transcriptional regulator [Micromonosporaceae bacterium]|nr:TetR family transcriptional regulator [Micromonosporaceae bacterium]